jgi:WbqC-like protein family
MKRIVSAHQPNFLPYLGFFDKMIRSDVFVIRDEVQFVERDYHHRNRIRINSPPGDAPQCKWIRVPVVKERTDLKHIRIRNDLKDKNVPWNIFMLRQVRSNYETAPYFGEYFPDLDLILRFQTARLIDLNMAIISWLQSCFSIDTEVVYASQLNYGKTGDPTRDLVKIAEAVGADVYLSGSGGRSYLNQAYFYASGLDVQFQAFNHPVYQQQYAGFVPNLAAIDALFNVGDIFSGQRVHGPLSRSRLSSSPPGRSEGVLTG